MSVEALAQLRLQQKVKTNYVFFTEVFSADEISKLFATLAREDKKAEARKDAQLEKLVVMPLSATSQRTLAQLLGADPKTFLPKAKPAAVLDPEKPLSDDTAAALAKALAEKDKNGPHVIALSYNPIRPNPVSSKEMREFLAARKERKRDAVPVMIVLRNME